MPDAIKGRMGSHASACLNFLINRRDHLYNIIAIMLYFFTLNTLAYAGLTVWSDFSSTSSPSLAADYTSVSIFTSAPLFGPDSSSAPFVQVGRCMNFISTHSSQRRSLRHRHRGNHLVHPRKYRRLRLRRINPGHIQRRMPEHIREPRQVPRLPVVHPGK